MYKDFDICVSIYYYIKSDKTIRYHKVSKMFIPRCKIYLLMKYHIQNCIENRNLKQTKVFHKMNVGKVHFIKESLAKTGMNFDSSLFYL